MAMQHLLFAVFMTSILHAAFSETAYDVLEHNNLPRGLLPQGVQSYTLRDGALEVTLAGECNFSVTIAGKEYNFRYDRTIGGVLKSGSISQVHGVSVQVAFVWLGFNQVDRDGEQLNIHLEAFTKSFPVSNFARSPICS